MTSHRIATSLRNECNRPGVAHAVSAFSAHHLKKYDGVHRFMGVAYIYDIQHIFSITIFISLSRVYMFCPISQSRQFANWSADLQIGICPICKLCQPISFHDMKVSNVGRQQSEILTIVISVNIIHGRRLPVMLVLCHNLCRLSSFNTRYFSRNH